LPVLLAFPLLAWIYLHDLSFFFHQIFFPCLGGGGMLFFLGRLGGGGVFFFLEALRSPFFPFQRFSCHLFLTQEGMIVPRGALLAPPPQDVPAPPFLFVGHPLFFFLSDEKTLFFFFFFFLVFFFFAVAFFQTHVSRSSLSGGKAWEFLSR